VLEASVLEAIQEVDEVTGLYPSQFSSLNEEDSMDTCFDISRHALYLI
jgi:hypothetical protein